MTPIRRLPAQGCILLAVLALAACGGGGGGGGAQGSATPSTPPVVTVPPPTTPVDPTPPASAPSAPPTDTGPGSSITCTSGDTPVVAAANFELVNAVRADAGVPQLVYLPALGATAQDHARYVAFNGNSGSSETAGLPCFTGATVEERLAAAGVAPVQRPGMRPHGESVLAYDAPSSAAFGPAKIVEDALNNLYGRMLLLNPMAQQGGVGMSVQPQRRALVLDVAGAADASASSDSFAVWPRDGSTGLPVRMLASNMKPLDAALTEGYPVTLHALAPVQVSRFAMTYAGSGNPVAATLVTSANDRHAFLSQNEAALVPEAPLAAGTQYRVELDAIVGTTAVHRSWLFTTAP
ncbi:MAG: CAP domain-containing protein [Rubrivivax sp.]|nr:MAG: CAP domain-containing protein [Rubrivivax sp.]